MKVEGTVVPPMLNAAIPVGAQRRTRQEDADLVYFQVTTNNIDSKPER